MRLVLVAALCACSGSSDVTGPFSGEVRRFAVDAITVPRDSAQASMFAADLDGDGMAENQLGNVTGVLATTNDLSTHAPDMIAAGSLASFVDIQADDLVDDATVGVTYFGADGAAAVVAGGTLRGGTFVSNRTADTEKPGMATVQLPIYVNADPLVLPLEAMEIELSPDGTGGYHGIVRGGLAEETARAAAYAGLVQMFETEPERHIVFLRGVDTNFDDMMTREEVDASVIAILVSADVELFGKPSLSVAFGVHLVPAPLAAMTPANRCRDRVKDGDETDVDCGGSCQPCWTGKTCGAPIDCQSRACNGTCGAPTCTDNVRDGFESDVDCGGSCPACAAGKACAADRDCASGSCDNGASLGRCS